MAELDVEEDDDEECTDFVVEDVVEDDVQVKVIRETVCLERTCDVWVEGDEGCGGQGEVEGKATPVNEEHAEIVSRLREVTAMKQFVQVPSLKSRNRSEVMAQVKLVNGVIEKSDRGEWSIDQ